MLQIASTATITATSVEEAKSNIPPLHAQSIPVSILNTLVTCIATVSRDHRRCRRPRLLGSDYCTIHADTSFLTTNTQLTTKRRHDVTDENNIAPSCKKRKILFKSIATLKDDMSTFFKSCSPYVQNLLQWDIQCAEDAFCSERNAPFALGLLVRRYFPGYGTCVVTFGIICCYEYVLHI